MTIVKRSASLVLIAVQAMGAQAITMQELFDGVNANGNLTGPSVIQGQTMNVYSGGSLFMRSPQRTYTMATLTPPSLSAGCGGIDTYLGSFGHINSAQFVAMLKNIGSNALGYGFKLAITNLCPTCANVTEALQATANFMNSAQVNSCEAAKGIVNASIPDTWTKDTVNTAKVFGVDSGQFANVAESWEKVYNNWGQAASVNAKAVALDPTKAAFVPSGNVVWKALKRVNNLDDNYRMLLMSLVGTVILDPSSGAPRPVMGTGISIETLIGQAAATNSSVVYLKCDTVSVDGCLNPTPANWTAQSFRTMIRKKMEDVVDHMVNRAAYADPAATYGFLGATELPVYKMLAVATSGGNTAMADAMIGHYQELIAAKYAETYLQELTRDLRYGLSQVNSGSDATSSQAIRDLSPALEQISSSARAALSSAYAKAASTHNIALEVAHMERALNSSLSQNLRSSLAFGRSLR